MNPFDLRGPEFLQVYLFVFVTMTVLAGLLRWFLRLPADRPTEQIELEPYDIAYLVSKQRAIESAMAVLVQSKILGVDVGARKLQRIAPLASTAHPIERAVYQCSASGDIDAVKGYAQTALPAIRAKLQRHELVPAGIQALWARWVPFLLFCVVPLIGSIKIAIGISRSRPVGILVFLVIIACGVAIFFLVGPHRTRRGSLALKDLKKENAALETTARVSPNRLSGDDLVIAFALFGMDILASGDLANFKLALRPPQQSSGSSCSSCGSSCGGGGGGGCGGCGGG